MNTTLERIIINGTLQYLARAFKQVIDQSEIESGQPNAALTPKFISSSDKWHILKNLQEQSGTFHYPYLFLKLTNVAIPEANESYNPKALLRAGVYGGVDDSKTAYRRHRIIPVSMTCEVSFITNDFWQSIAFSNAWLFAALKKDMNFNVVFDNVSYSIQVELDKNLAIPEKDETIDIPNNYEMLGNLIIRGYYSENKAWADIERYPIFRTLQVNPILTPPNQSVASYIAQQQELDLGPQYIEIPNDDPFYPTEYEKVTLEIKNIDDAPDET